MCKYKPPFVWRIFPFGALPSFSPLQVDPVAFIMFNLKLLSSLASAALCAAGAVASPLDARGTTAVRAVDVTLTTRMSDISPLSAASIQVFHPGLGACGELDSDSDPVVALSTILFDHGAHCLQASIPCFLHIPRLCSNRHRNVVVKDRS